MPKPMRQLLVNKRSIFIAIVYTIALAVVCLMPTESIHEAPAGTDKVVHAFAYIIFTILWFLAIFFLAKEKFRKAIIFSALLALIFGMVIELLQSELTTYRTADWYDVFANMIGVTIGIIIINLYKTRLKS